MDQFCSAGAASLVSVVKADKSPFKAFCLNENGFLESLFDEHLSNARRQDLPQCYFPNGAIYMFRISTFKQHGGFPSNGGVPFIMSARDSIDIDDEADLVRAALELGEINV
jgi:CMP-N-acetylneuraminic acid synthetase